MNYWIGIIGILFFGLTSCENKEQAVEKNITVFEEEDLIEVMPNMYREYYPGKKQIKIMGPLDNEGRRHGAWESYFENGQKNSATYYINGVKEGHSIVYYPNGAVYYYGEYKNDEKTGIWKTFNELGEQISEDEF